MQFDSILYSVHSGIATITLNTPGNLNAFNELMIKNVTEALNLSACDENVNVVVINANGKAFSGGGDLAAMAHGIKEGVPVIKNTVGIIAEVSLKIKTMSKPVIASVSGAVAGAAFNIALACDFCIAAEGSKFIQAFVNVGLIPDAGGLFLLTKAVGVNKAAHLAMLGTPVTVDEAKELGFVYKVCPITDLTEQTNLLAVKLADGPLKSYALMKQLIFESEFQNYESYTKLEVESQIACSNTGDFIEGITAFLEKRKANFAGK